MAEIKVVAVVDGNNYDLQMEDGSYKDEIVAPQSSTSVVVQATDEAGNTSSQSTELIVDKEWLPPKTDWTAQDYFNAIDYNRLINNISHLNAMASRLFNGITLINMGEEKDYTSPIYASWINAIENALDTINTETYSFDFGESTEYKANGSTPLWSEFNRLESSMLKLYDTMKAHKEALPRLAFTLGGQKGLRV